MRQNQLDSIDYKILAVIQHDNDISTEEIAKKVHLSPTPCWRRMKVLREQGYIDKSVALLNPKKFNLLVEVFVSIETEKHSDQWLDEFAACVQAIPYVINVYRIAGATDYILHAIMPSMREYDVLYKRIIQTNGIRNMTANIVMDRVKHTTALPIQQPKGSSANIGDTSRV